MLTRTLREAADCAALGAGLATIVTLAVEFATDGWPYIDPVPVRQPLSATTTILVAFIGLYMMASGWMRARDNGRHAQDLRDLTIERDEARLLVTRLHRQLARQPMRQANGRFARKDVA